MDGKRITNVYEAGKILEKLRNQHALIQVSMPGVPDVFFSSILAVNVDNQFILLDELSKKAAHDLLLVHKNLVFESKLDGIGIHFSCALTSADTEHGAHIYKLAFPDHILYFQKRNNFRINIGLGTNIPVKFKRDDGTPVFGRIINLSETGIGVILDAPYHLSMSEVLPYCDIRLDDENSVTCQLEIRYATDDKQDHCQHIGGKFIGMSNTDQRTISKLVIELQRDLMRRLPKNDA